VLRANVFGTDMPLTVLLSVTNRCMSNCIYCYCEDECSPDIDGREVKSLIDQAASMGCRTIWFIGGEPLLREDIIEIARYSKDKGLSACIASNGHLLSEKIEILEVIDNMVISLDGPEEMHNANRGAGSFAKAMRAIEAALRKITVSTHTVITKNNLKGIDFVIKNAVKHHLQANFSIVRGCGESVTPDSEECREVYRRLIQDKKSGAPVMLSIQTLKTMLSWPDYSKAVYSKRETVPPVKCFAGSLFCYVHHNGDVYRCNELLKKTKALNYLSSGFKQAFKSLKTNIPDCAICNDICMLDMSYLHSLNFGAVINCVNNRLCRKM
jgi:MoaA/NifB/PqqE/SkfB family radical SAM enzyme